MGRLGEHAEGIWWTGESLHWCDRQKVRGSEATDASGTCRYRGGLVQHRDTRRYLAGSVIPHRQVLALKSGIIKPFARLPPLPSDVCEVSEERREEETGPFPPDKMMQVLVKGGGSSAVLLQLLSLVCVHTWTHAPTSNSGLERWKHYIVYRWTSCTHTHSSSTPPLLQAL